MLPDVPVAGKSYNRFQNAKQILSRTSQRKPSGTESGAKLPFPGSCSAGWQPAVSPTGSRQDVDPGRGLRITNPRHSRLPVCATNFRAPFAALFLAASACALPAADEIPVAKFTDITREAGITFVHNNGAYGDKLLPETMGIGVAFFDYDNDGHQDLLFIMEHTGPGTFPKAKRRRPWRSITTTATAISPTSPKVRVSTSVATAWAWPSGLRQ